MRKLKKKKKVTAPAKTLKKINKTKYRRRILPINGHWPKSNFANK